MLDKHALPGCKSLIDKFIGSNASKQEALTKSDDYRIVMRANYDLITGKSLPEKAPRYCDVSLNMWPGETEYGLEVSHVTLSGSPVTFDDILTTRSR